VTAGLRRDGTSVAPVSRVRRNAALFAVVSILVAGCGSRPGGSADPDPGPTIGPPQTAKTECADVFDQDLLPTYQVEIAPEEWALLEEEFLQRNEREEAGLDVNPWHPIVFRYRDEVDEVIDTAMIRLKGKWSWRHAIARDPDPKMQFVISFNEVERTGRFHGLRKIDLDQPRNDRSYVRQRLALSLLRDLELPAQCANHARLVINGEYYGLFTNMEHMDREFLRRTFPGESGGDLWESGRELKTNETTSTDERLDALFSVATVEEMGTLADLEAAVRSWSAEAMMPNSDGYYGGHPHNYYLYDHPRRGFLWLSYDLDGTFDFLPFDVDPLFWSRSVQPHPHYLLLLADPAWMVRYVDALEDALEAYDVPTLQGRIAAWAEQIATAAAEEPHRPFTMDQHLRSVGQMREFVEARASFVRSWIDCRRGGGEDPDGDGAAWCFDCAEGDPTVHPDAREVCGNALDDDCDGYVDEACR
jgi:hypothetical protein